MLELVGGLKCLNLYIDFENLFRAITVMTLPLRIATINCRSAAALGLTRLGSSLNIYYNHMHNIILHMRFAGDTWFSG